MEVQDAAESEIKQSHGFKIGLYTEGEVWICSPLFKKYPTQLAPNPHNRSENPACVSLSWSFFRQSQHEKDKSSNLRMCHWHRSDTSIDGGPGASGEHASKQWVQISGSQSTTVPLHSGHVASDQCLPQPAVVQPELRLKDLSGVTRTCSWMRPIGG